MKAFFETVAALGQPLLARNIGPCGGPRALIARWQHGNAHVETSAVDALRVCLSLRGGHTVRQGSDPRSARAIVGGSVGVFAPDRFSDVYIEGQADVVQIFVDPAYLDDAAGHHVICKTSLAYVEAELQAAVLQLFVSARRRGPDDDLLMETTLWRIVEHLVSRHISGRLKDARGGLAGGALSRVDELIADRFGAEEMRAPSIDELADAARMSPSHFIRAFGRTTGVTPHQYVLTHRIERAMGLLAEPGRSIAEVADGVGYGSPSHFVASFKRRLGMTPGAYRAALL